MVDENAPIVLRILSFIIIAVGVSYGGYEGVIEPMQPGHSFGYWDKIELVIGLAVTFLGLLSNVFSQVADTVLSKNKKEKA